MADNVFDLVIEDDGTITVNTDGFSPELHKKAEEFMRDLQSELGAKITTKQKAKHAHVHAHGGKLHVHS